MWIVFLRNFKKLFTTEDIVESTKNEMENILKDFNRQTERNLSLLDNSISRIKYLNADAEKKIKVLSEMERSQLEVADFHKKITQGKPSPAGGNHNAKQAVSAYEKTRNSSSKKNISIDDTVVLTREGEQLTVQPMQQTLFSEKPEIPVNSDMIMDSHGASYTEIPVVTPDVYVPEQLVSLSKAPEDLNQKILRMYDQGYEPDAIATELSCSVTEVQFVLSVEGRL